MTGFLWAALGVLGGLGMTALGDMVSEEVRDRLDYLPHTILRLAARRLDPAQRVTVYEDEWLPELAYILKGDEARPITRLVHGTRYAVGICFGARRVAGSLHREAPAGQPALIIPWSNKNRRLIFEMVQPSLFEGLDDDQISRGDNSGDGQPR